jgi:hypothetical protein
MIVVLISTDCVFDASLVPETCPGRFLDLKGLINRFLESASILTLVTVTFLTGIGTSQGLRA